MYNLEWKAIAGQALTILALSAFVVFLYKLVKMRMIFYRLKKQGLPMPTWDFVAGHLKVLPELLKQLPKGSQQSDAFTILSRNFPETDSCFYIDLWPFTMPLLVVTSPDLAVQACQTYALPKPDILNAFVDPLAGGPTMFTQNGPEWKRSRDLFNNRFSTNVLMKLAPKIVKEAEVYVDVLREHARKGDMFFLDKITCDYVMDIIGVLTLNARLQSQRQHNPLAAAMRSSIEWHCQDEELNPFKRWNPMRPLIEWHNGRTMNRYIGQELEKRYEEWKRSDNPVEVGSIMDLVIAESMKKKQDTASHLDPAFKTWATQHIRLFLFVGHDATASTIVYSLYLMSKHPDILARVRAEHDAVFGPDLSTTASQLSTTPELINRLPYTLAVIKETLRLFSPASGMREGQPNVNLRSHRQGTLFPTSNLYIWIIHGAIHRNPDYWPSPHEFLPDRWLVGPEDPLYPARGAWRPFEHGLRDCVGQNLALLDIKITLALTVRAFNFTDQYEQWDRIHPLPGNGVRTVFGERAYQIPLGGAHPADGLPCKVRVREV
ncbi:cytochrome P450 71B25 [Aspergillus steynii IBT 23096]|uniref:Cytochrome P450 71B25 n=1 Tax=Aspergillus steynii IBT 23096 TaxID=1392250 RepID=A0A2I2FY48_9EURO|nr:cytochrome P450 71B25 [Aspergillus steynii IBT 23096]PLB45553.1 cytochrome P450 71B25 [Aspergillus steynii IBT 23096]